MQQIFAPHATDFYKTGHYRQYPEGTTQVYANLTPRAGNYANPQKEHIVLWGPTIFVLDHLICDWNESFFHENKDVAIRRLKRRMDNSLGVGTVTTKHFEDLYDLGYLPLHIKSLPEAALVPYRTACVTIYNTHPDFAWLTLYIESALSAYIWKLCTSATAAYEMRLLLNKYCELTGVSPDAARFHLHDFSMRGMSGVYDAYISGTGHLLSSAGTDNILSIDALEDFGIANSDNELIAGGVPATEHSVMCMGGEAGEIDTFRRLFKVYPTGIVSIVSDTWDYWKVITEVLPVLKVDILARQRDVLGFCKTVIRPDSGDPVRIVAGYLDSEVQPIEGHYLKGAEWRVTSTGVVITDAERKGTVECLWDIFGGTTNEAGFRELDEHIGLIYGDGITYERMNHILFLLAAKKFVATSCVYGIGSYSYQGVTRDTHGFAVKATFGVVNDESRELYKDPKTDSGLKKSAKGLIMVDFVDGEYVQIDQATPEEEESGELETIFYNGQGMTRCSLTELRSRLGVF